MILRLWRVLIAWLRWKLSQKPDRDTLHSERMESLERAHRDELRAFDEELNPPQQRPYQVRSNTAILPGDELRAILASSRQQQAMNAGIAQYGSQGSQLQNMLASAQYRLDSSATSNLSASQLQNSREYWDIWEKIGKTQ